MEEDRDNSRGNIRTSGKECKSSDPVRWKWRKTEVTAEGIQETVGKNVKVAILSVGKGGRQRQQQRGHIRYQQVEHKKH